MKAWIKSVSVGALLVGGAFGPTPGWAAVVVDSEMIRSTAQAPAANPWAFATIPSPMTGDAAESALFSLGVGQASPASASLNVLHNGEGQPGGDDPGNSFFFWDFTQPTDGRGRIVIDLGASLPIGRITIFSRHEGEGDTPKGVRGPLHLRVYASNNPVAPDATDLAQWTTVGSVNQTDLANDGGNFTEWRGYYASNFRDDVGNALGDYRHVLIDVDRPSYAGTFLGEIDIVAIPEPVSLVVLMPMLALLRYRSVHTK